METRPRDNKIFLKNEVKFVDYRMKWMVLPHSESYFKETKYILVNFYHFSCISEYYKTYSTRKRTWIVYNFSAFVNVPAESPSYAPTFAYC